MSSHLCTSGSFILAYYFAILKISMYLLITFILFALLYYYKLALVKIQGCLVSCTLTIQIFATICRTFYPQLTIEQRTCTLVQEMQCKQLHLSSLEKFRIMPQGCLNRSSINTLVFSAFPLRRQPFLGPTLPSKSPELLCTFFSL